jgi:hypothetical protein
MMPMAILREMIEGIAASALKVCVIHPTILTAAHMTTLALLRLCTPWYEVHIQDVQLTYGRGGGRKIGVITPRT